MNCKEGESRAVMKREREWYREGNSERGCMHLLDTERDGLWRDR